jgi:cytochrome c biogenesis protein CcmG, thiol:disulfide interchange protein DsbE
VNKKGVALLIILAAVIAVIFSISRPKQTAKITTDSAVPDFSFVDSENHQVRLSDLRGSVVFVNFWATWCGSCIEEIPSIEKLYRQLSENPHFKMVTILVKDDLRRASGFMKQNGYTFPVYLNTDESAAKYFGITGVPETFILDKKGILRHKVIGPTEWDSPDVMQNLQALINEPYP